MKILVYEWTSYFQNDIYAIFQEKGISFDTFGWKFRDKNEDEEFIEWFGKNYTLEAYDALFSVNYYPLLSMVCKEKNVKYISWCYDNPLNVEKIEETLGNEINYVFLYDRVQYETYKNKGYNTVYHQLLGVNKSRFDNLIITPDEHKKYDADVSFVGQLYESKYYDIIAPLDDYTKGYLQALISAQSKVYGVFLAKTAITDEIVGKINDQYLKINPNTNFSLSKEALLFAMGSEVTRKDRMILLSLCGNRYNTKFYSNDDSELLTNVEKCGRINYITEMPQMFACSKVNLNPSLRLIESGIPQRAYDIMASGGLLVSNFQPELAEYYVDGEDVIMYESYEEAIDKISYYLSNDALRLSIANNGRAKTLNDHSMQECLKNIFVISNIQ